MRSENFKLPPVGSSARELRRSDAQALGQRIKNLRKSLKLNQSEFAKLLNTSQPTVSRWETGLFKPQDTQFITRMASLARVSIAEFRYGKDENVLKIPVIGNVSVGGSVKLFSNMPEIQNVEMVPSAEGVGDEPMVALRVLGDSMMPLLRHGWLLFFHQEKDGVPDDCFGRLCVVRIADHGPIYVKDVIRGSRKNTFLLNSVTSAPMDDVRLEWAARVISIRPS
jgi:transcriptional regulator with XRE-family HTH domain